MAITEESRFQLHQRLNDVLGKEHATTLMEHLPPIGWADVATKRDLDQQSVLLRQEMTSEFTLVRQEMASEFTLVRQEMASEFTLVRQEMRSGFALVESEFGSVRTEMGALGDRLEKQISERSEALQNRMTGLTAFIGAYVTLLGVAVGAFSVLVK